MTKLSISKAWDEARAILGRDGRLFVAVALAMIVVPGTISDLVTPAAPAGELPEPGTWMIVAAIAIVIGMIGQLAMARLAMTPGLTVGDSIRHGAARLPSYIGATLLWIAPFALAVALLVPRLAPAQPDPAVVLLFLAIAIAGLVIAVRFLLTLPVTSAEQAGPVEILRRSWALTRGRWWKLFGFLLIFLIAVLIVMVAVGSVIGTTVGLAFGEIEPLSIGALLVALVTKIVTALVSVVFVVMLARIYAELAASPTVSVPEVDRAG